MYVVRQEGPTQGVVQIESLQRALNNPLFISHTPPHGSHKVHSKREGLKALKTRFLFELCLLKCFNSCEIKIAVIESRFKCVPEVVNNGKWYHFES